jgi:hypothetical protein
MLDYETLLKDIDQTKDEFKQDMSTDESREYRRGYYAGRLHALLEIQANLTDE